MKLFFFRWRAASEPPATVRYAPSSDGGVFLLWSRIEDF